MTKAESRHAGVLSPDLDALTELAAAVARRSDEFEEVLQRICTALAKSFGFDRVVMHRYHEETSEIAPLVAHGRDHFAKPYRFPISQEPLLEQVLQAGKAVYVESVRAEYALAETALVEYQPSSVVCAPLIVEGQCLGFMSGDLGGRHFAFSDEALQILETFAAITAVFLEKALDHHELRRLNELRSQFVALASHELRTPAASIYGAAVTLERRSGQLEDGQLRALHRLLYEQSDRLRILVDELLDLSRLDAGSIPIRPEPIDVLSRLESVLRELFSERVQDVRVEVAQGLAAQADPHAFDRIVSNLLANAFLYGKPPVTIGAAVSDGHISVTVEDSGPGVPAEFEAKLFEPFTRASRDVTGAGLGLSIARSLAQAQSGELHYRHVHPHGARFELELPNPAAG
jgi:signal transduction histidine kinase